MNAKNFLNAGAFVFIGTIFYQGAYIGGLTLLTHFINSVEYGRLIYILTTIQLFSLLAGGGIGNFVIKIVSSEKSFPTVKYNRLRDACLVLLLIFNFFCCVVLLLLGDVILFNFNLFEFLLVFLSIIFISLDAYNKSIILGARRFKFFALCHVFGAVVLVILLMGGNYFLKGVDNLFVFAIYFFVQYLLSRFFLKDNYSFSFIGCRASFEDYKEVIFFVFPALVANLAIFFTVWYMQYVLKDQHKMNDLAFLGVCNQWFNMLMFLPTIASKVALPFMAEEKNTHGIAERILKSTVMFSGGLLILLSLIIFLFKDQIYLIYGAGYDSIGDYIFLVSLAAIFSGMSASFGNYLIVKDLMHFGALTNVFWSTVALATYFFVFDEFTVRSNIVSTIFAYAGSFLFSLLIYISFRKEK